MLAHEVTIVNIEQKYEKLKAYLHELGSVAIGFSGGVDSSFLATVARQELGDKVLAITVKSVFNPPAETEFARQFAKQLGIAHGGVLSTLIDTSLGVVAASLGKRVVTLQLSTNYINSIYFFDKASATATIVHKGMTTMVIDVVVRNRKEEIVATGTGTMFVVGKFDEIPESW